MRNTDAEWSGGVWVFAGLIWACAKTWIVSQHQPRQHRTERYNMLKEIHPSLCGNRMGHLRGKPSLRCHDRTSKSQTYEPNSNRKTPTHCQRTVWKEHNSINQLDTEWCHLAKTSIDMIASKHVPDTDHTSSVRTFSGV